MSGVMVAYLSLHATKSFVEEPPVVTRRVRSNHFEFEGIILLVQFFFQFHFQFFVGREEEALSGFSQHFFVEAGERFFLVAPRLKVFDENVGVLLEQVVV